jgi:hypothetical protein
MRRLSYANVAATLALVLSMSGGALAASHYLVNSTKQINPKVLKKLKGASGAAGARGATGAAGVPGAPGAEGKQGLQGKEGKEGRPGNATVAQGFVQSTLGAPIALETSYKKGVLSTHTSGHDLVLSNGALVFVQATLRVVNTGAGAARVECQLEEEGHELEEAIPYGEVSTVEIPAGSQFEELPLTGAVEISGPETYDMRVRCKLASPGQTANVLGGSLNAVAYE